MVKISPEAALKELREAEERQRDKTEEHYRDYRNSGIAISTIFLTFVSGFAYKVLEFANTSDVKQAYAVMTGLIIGGIFFYQVFLYTGFRLVAHGHYYRLRFIGRLVAGEAENSLSERANEFHNDSNVFFGRADRLFIVICFGLIGHALVSGLVYLRYPDISNLSVLLVAFCFPAVIGICRSYSLRT